MDNTTGILSELKTKLRQLHATYAADRAAFERVIAHFEGNDQPTSEHVPADGQTRQDLVTLGSLDSLPKNILGRKAAIRAIARSNGGDYKPSEARAVLVAVGLLSDTPAQAYAEHWQATEDMADMIHVRRNLWRLIEGSTNGHHVEHTSTGDQNG